MWELRCATDDHELASDATAPRMRTLNAHVGRQVWTYVEDDDAEEEEETTTTTRRMGSVTTRAFLDAMRRAQDDMRETFVKTRGEMKHARDAFARAQYDARRARRGVEVKTTPPSASEIDSGRVEGEGVRGEVLRRAMRAGIEYYRGIQDDDGHWASDYGGPMFLMPGLIIAARVMGLSLIHI